MKRIQVYFITLIALLVVFSCKKEITTDDTTLKLTYYPVVSLKGAADTIIAQGATWVDPGAVVSTGIPYTKNDITTTATGVQFINYVAINEDGFASSASRMVFIVVAGNDNGVDRSGTYNGGRGAIYSNSTGGDGTVYLTKSSVPGVYLCSDIFCRYYEVYRDYGAAYHCPGAIRFNADNSVDMGGGLYPSPWDPSGASSYISAGSGSVDGAGKIVYKLVNGGSLIATAFFLEKL